MLKEILSVSELSYTELSSPLLTKCTQ